MAMASKIGVKMRLQIIKLATHAKAREKWMMGAIVMLSALVSAAAGLGQTFLAHAGTIKKSGSKNEYLQKEIQTE